jgi:phosphatidylglycerol:prolipoprotein diacylglycerol transferase
LNPESFSNKIEKGGSAVKVDLNPILIDLGPIRLSWYGLMYVFGFVASYLLVQYQMKRKDFGVTQLEIENLYFYLILGLVVGARLGYVLFYNLEEYLQDPFGIVAIWRGGMSFHGGLVGVLLTGILFAWKHGKSFWKIADLIIVTVPIGLGLGRIGNFINGELYGRVTQVPWGMIFRDGGPLPRHPSQLYECTLEGGVLFLGLWLLKDRKLPSGALLAVFLGLYGVFRFFVEFFREPDKQLGFIAGPFTMGQVLTSFMILGSLLLLFYLYRRADVQVGREREQTRSSRRR